MRKFIKWMLIVLALLTILVSAFFLYFVFVLDDSARVSKYRNEFESVCYVAKKDFDINAKVPPENISLKHMSDLRNEIRHDKVIVCYSCGGDVMMDLDVDKYNGKAFLLYGNGVTVSYDVCDIGENKGSFYRRGKLDP